MSLTQSNMTRQRKRALALRDKGWSYREIGVELGVNVSTAWKWCNPERTSQLNRRSNVRRRSQRRAWDREYWRREDIRGRCGTCGDLMGVGVAHDGTCTSCRRDAKEVRWRRIQALWAAGATVLEICAEFGWTKGYLSGQMALIREAGWDLPYRYKNTKRQRSAV